MTSPRSSSPWQPHPVLYALIPVLMAAAYIIFTGSVWEDYLITFRHTENLVRGHGLVYQPGERVHGFTSVINTLLPALPLWLGASFEGALLFYQVCSLFALGFGSMVLARTLEAKVGLGRVQLAGIAVLVGCSTKIIAFSSNGQEGGFLICFWSLGLAAALSLEERHGWRNFGLAAAGLLYTRPDSPLYIVILAFVGLAHADFRVRRVLPPLLRAAGLAAVLYAPWFLWAWSYYGNPIPHTVLAKSSGALLVEGSLVKTLLAMSPQSVMVLLNIFGPIYPPANWPEPLLLLCLLAGLAAAVYWAVPVRDRFGRSCSFGLLVLLVYIAFTGAQRLAFPWYFVPACLLAAIVTVRMTRQLWLWPRRGARAGAGVAFVLVVAASGTTLLLTFQQMRIQQEEIENGTRRALGTFLRNNARPGDSVYAECLGYIGYYYGGKMLDYPGLVAPEVVRARREHGDKYELVPEVLKPNWIVARPVEIEAILKREALRDAYEVLGTADARERLNARGRFTGDASVRFDELFYILKRRDAASVRP